MTWFDCKMQCVRFVLYERSSAEACFGFCTFRIMKWENTIVPTQNTSPNLTKQHVRRSPLGLLPERTLGISKDRSIQDVTPNKQQTRTFVCFGSSVLVHSCIEAELGALLSCAQQGGSAVSSRISDLASM